MFESVRKLISRTLGVRSEVQEVVPELATKPMLRCIQDEFSELKTVQGKLLWQVQNEEQEVRQRILTTPYGLQLDEFRSVLLPTLCRFPFVPEAATLNLEMVKNLWLASAPFCSKADWETKCAASDARDALLRLHPVVLETCCVLRRNYEDLRRAKAAGCSEVKVVARKSCSCLRRLDGQFLNVDQALGGFDAFNSSIWLLPLIEGGCAKAEDPSVCDVSVLAIPPVPTGDDKEFAHKLRLLLRSEEP